MNSYMDKCDKTIKSIQNFYNELLESIYCIIPNSWRNSKTNVYNIKINNFISNINVELESLVQAFSGHIYFNQEMLDYKNDIVDEVQFEEHIINIKKKCESINTQIDKYVELVDTYADENNLNLNIREIGSRAEKSIELFIGFIEEDCQKYYSKKTRLRESFNKSIAVIIPAYNTKNTIRRAIDSIANQSIIDILPVKTYIVNDCSIYNYQDVVTEYGSIINIEEVELKENVGPGLARQNGILKSIEDFIIFLDGDDFFYDENSLEILLTNAINNNADCVASYFREELSDRTYRNSNNMGWLHGKLYKSSFLKEKNIEFLDSRATEDAAFNMLLQVNNPNIVFIPDITYVWASNEDSITRKNNYEFSHTYIESYSENIRKILELTADKNLNMQVAIQHSLNALFVIWTNYITFNDATKRENVLKWTYGLKKSFDRWKPHYLNNDMIYDVFKIRKNLYNPKWTPGFARDCFNNFLRQIENYNSTSNEVSAGKKKMNILISLDEDYTCHAINMLNSIVLNNDVSLDIYLIYENLTHISINVIRDYIDANKVGTLHEYYINGNVYKFPHTIQYIPEVTYYRLFAPFIINESIDRLLYLDCDLIVNGSLDELYNTYMEDNIIAGCKNMLCKEMSYLNKVFNTNLGLPLTNDYINAGVILIDIAKYKDFITPDQIISFINENEAHLKMQDQDVINKLFYGKIKHVDNKYNYQINTVEDDYQENDFRIIHYSQRAKPWHNDYYSPKKAKYYYDFLAKKGDIESLKEIVGLHMDCMKNKIIINAMINFNGEQNDRYNYTNV